MPTVHNGMDCLFRVYKEKIPENGEDSFCYSVHEDALLLGVFDGCGGSGAKRYVNYQDKTGAYIAARAVAGAVLTWFERCEPAASAGGNAQAIQLSIKKALRLCKERSGRQGEMKLRGSIAKEFPTTAAIAYCASAPRGISLDCYWAGDSRVYILDEDGLAQITRDDLDGLDALENISATKAFKLHSTRLTLRKPFLVFSASDGCFGYIPTPMEFEAYVIEHLLRSRSMTEFERSMCSGLEKIAGDDYSLVGASFGFGTYVGLQNSLKRRYQLLKKQYVHPLKNASSEETAALWNGYRGNYYRYLAVEEQGGDLT